MMNAVKKCFVVTAMFAAMLTLSAMTAADRQGQAQSEEIRAMLAALEHAKAGERGVPFALSPRRRPPSDERHDSATLRALSSVALRVIDPAAPRIIDTMVLGIMKPVRTPDGAYTMRVSGALARISAAGECRVGGPSINYSVVCNPERCVPQVVSKATGSGRCQ
jgi:hypothetical protein